LTAQRLLERESPVLRFVVIRASSKLAEIDPALVDASVLLRAAWQLDGSGTPETKGEEAILARTIGKLRQHAHVELLIHLLRNGGVSAKIIATRAIGLMTANEQPIFYTTKLQAIGRPHHDLVPPSKALLGELFGLDIDDDSRVVAAARLADQELRAAIPGLDVHYGALWGVRNDLVAVSVYRTPFIGTVVKVTLENMLEVSQRVGLDRVACLTEPRIVDSLFDHASALLILEQELDSPQCRRLRARGIPFAMLSKATMDAIRDDDDVAVFEHRVALRRSRTARAGGRS
jgi:hypothetical protein